MIEAALAKGVKKFILVTSIGCGDSKDAPGEQVRHLWSCQLNQPVILAALNPVSLCCVLVCCMYVL